MLSDLTERSAMPRREGDPQEASAESSSAPAVHKPKVYELVERLNSSVEKLITMVLSTLRLRTKPA